MGWDSAHLREREAKKISRQHNFGKTRTEPGLMGSLEENFYSFGFATCTSLFQ